VRTSQLCAALRCVCPRLTNLVVIISTLLISASLSRAATIVVPAGGNLQAAINGAAPGDTIVLDAGATYTGPFTLPAKSGDAYITIQSSRASEITGRVSPSSHSSLLAKLRANFGAEPIIRTAAGAHHYRLIGLEVSTFTASDFIYDLVRLGTGDSTQSDLSTVPHHLILDRLWVHGFATQDLQRGISLNSAETSIINSYISDIHAIETDTQAICGWNGPGPYHIINNYIEAAAENIMFGGADPAIQNLVPSDIEIRGNHVFKPLTWKVGDPSYLGRRWSIKNLLELKNARRVTIDGNIFENNWVESQPGIPILFTARNQYGNAPWSVVEDVTFTNNRVTNTEGGVSILRTSPESNGAITRRITISNNIFEVSGFFDALVLLNSPNDIQIIHNTIFKGGNILTFDADPGNPKGTGLIIRDNLFSEGGYGVFGSGIGEGTAALGGYYSSYTYAKNNAAGRDASMYPAGNSFVLTSQVGFVNYLAGNYRLASGSAFKNAATDGKDVGVDMDALLAAQGSISASPTPTPTPTPTVTPTPAPTPTQTASLQFSSGTYSVSEDAGSISITVTRSGSTAGSASVTYSSLDVTASGFSDYGGLAGTLTFAAGESSKTVRISILNDTVAEGNETFNLILSGVSNANLGSPAVTTVTIVDNDKGRRIKVPRGGIIQKRVLQ
jgi:Calx-beta domain-containing protein